MKYLEIIIFFSLCVQIGTCANILFYFVVSTYSHRIIVWPLVEKLASLGHNVSFISPYPIKYPNPNVTDLVPSEITELFSVEFSSDSDIIKNRFEGDQNFVWSTLPRLGIQSCEKFLGSSKWRDWVERSSFDLVIIDNLYGECGLGLAWKWKAKVIYFKTNTILAWEYDSFGIPPETSWIPDVQRDFNQNMNFLTRLKNTMIPLYNYFYRVWFYSPTLEEIMRNGLQLQNLPSIHDLEGNISLVLMNTHYATDYARSLPPFLIPIAGMLNQAMEVEPLPEEMLNFINDSKDGFIYVSFGSAVQVSKLEQKIKHAFLYAFGNSTLRFLWKFEGKSPPSELPSNIMTREWMPQKSILNHPKCRGFITHGGLGSIHEAQAFGVPLIVMPIFADQDYNAERIHRLGFGISIEITTLTQNDLQNAILNLTTKNKYKQRMSEISTAFKDRETNPLDSAVWWTEKVLRMSEFENSLLKPVGRNQYWFVRRLIDVYLFLFLIMLFSILLIIYLFLKFLFQVYQTQSLSSSTLKAKSS